MITTRPAVCRAAAVIAAALTLAGCARPQTEADSTPRPAVPVVSRTSATSVTTQGAVVRGTPPAVPAPEARVVPAAWTPSAVLSVPPAARAVPSRGGVRLAPTARGPLSGRVVAVDPGHNGRFVARVDNRLVPAGNGRTKPCNTSGTSDVIGRSEHEFTWSVASSLAARLRALGATVLLTRPDDRGVGPCVDERARIGNAGRADLVLSVHADGNPSPRARGFHVIVSTRMAGGARAQQRSRLVAGGAIRALERQTRLRRSTYIGAGTALSPRSDIAGLNLSVAPAIMLEAGNMRQRDDAALLRDPAQRRALATALASAAVTALR